MLLLVLAIAGCNGRKEQETVPIEEPPRFDETEATGAIDAGDSIDLSVPGISGRVMLHGTPPPEKTIVMDLLCARTHSGATVTTRHYVVGENKGLGNVFVYVKEGVTGTFEPADEVPVLDQVDCIYTPYVMGVMAGQKFQVRNSDPLLHNVNTSRAKNNKGFNIAQPTKGMVRDVIFERPELFVPFRCDVHPWMQAFVAVVEHPYFAVTDENGFYTIRDLPPGNYTLEAVHLKAGQSVQRVTLEGESMAVNFAFQAL